MTSITERLNKLLFNRQVAQVLKTPPLKQGDRSFAALSMVHTRDVPSYLLAIKTFAAVTRPGRIVMVADPSISEDDRSVLRRHVPHIEIRDAVEFRSPVMPQGGCWERLSAIASINHEASIVQVDADTLTTGPLDDLVDALGSGRSAILRSEEGVDFVSLAEASRQGRERLARSQHVQVLCESRLDQLPGADTMRYVRGCAGFTAFAKAALSPDRLADLSSAMRAMLGPRWDDWGSEQFASNLLAASAPEAWLLPHPRYCNADSKAPETRLTHYIGYARFTSRTYERDARHMIASLAQES
jgi:hypothetical protein